MIDIPKSQTSEDSDDLFVKHRREIQTLAAGPDAPPAQITYLPEEDGVWQWISERLEPIWEKRVVGQVLLARDDLNLPTHRIPQLSEVNDRLEPKTGFRFHGVSGLVDVETFFGGLGNRRFMSTQFIRHPKNPGYTEEPDVVHEVKGHGTQLADLAFAELHRLAGSALVQAKDMRTRQAIANIWWFSGEFGVLTPSSKETTSGSRAYGAGLLSSVEELDSFHDRARIHPLNLAAMAFTKYRIDNPQTDLFAAKSVDHVLETVGGFFDTVTDANVDELLGRSAA